MDSLHTLIKAYLTVNPKPHSLQIANLACSIGVTADHVTNTMAAMISDIQCEDSPTEVLSEDPAATDVLQGMDESEVPTEDLILNDGTTDPSASDMSKEALVTDGVPEDESDYQANNDLLMNDGAQFPSTETTASLSSEFVVGLENIMGNVATSINEIKTLSNKMAPHSVKFSQDMMSIRNDLTDAHTSLMCLRDDIKDA